RCRPPTRIRRGIGSARSGSDCGRGHSGASCCATGDAHGSHCFRKRDRSSWPRLCRELGPSAGQCDRLRTVRIFDGHQVAGDTHRAYAVGQEGWLHVQSGYGSSGLYLRSIQQGALTHAIEPFAMPVDDESGVERSLSTLGQQPDSGLIVLQDAFTVQHRTLIIDQVARPRMTAVYPIRLYPESGGLVSYGVDFANQFRQAAIYVDLMLKGAKLGELPVQQPTKFELVLNLKIAKALGIEITPSL